MLGVVTVKLHSVFFSHFSHSIAVTFNPLRLGNHGTAGTGRKMIIEEIFLCVTGSIIIYSFML